MKKVFGLASIIAFASLVIFISFTTAKVDVVEQYIVDSWVGNVRINNRVPAVGQRFDFAVDKVSFETTADCLVFKNARNELGTIIPTQYTTNKAKAIRCDQCKCCKPILGGRLRTNWGPIQRVFSDSASVRGNE